MLKFRFRMLRIYLRTVEVELNKIVKVIIEVCVRVKSKRKKKKKKSLGLNIIKKFSDKFFSLEL